jgi:hypothetical protein
MWLLRNIHPVAVLGAAQRVVVGGVVIASVRGTAVV